METVAAILLIVVALLLGGGDTPPEPYHPPRAGDVCQFTHGKLHLEIESQFQRNTTHFTRIDFRGMTPAQAEAEVVRAYYWWAENVGPHSVHWFVKEARKQNVNITVYYGDTGRYPIPGDVRVNYPCR